MKRILLLVVSLFTLAPVSAQTGLTQEQKTEDFEFLFQILQENYPHFESTKESFGGDWLGRKEEFREMIRDTRSDKSFMETLFWDVVFPLTDATAKGVEVSSFGDVHKFYRESALKDPKLKTWQDEIASVEGSYDQWKGVLNQNDEPPAYDPRRNISTHTFGNGRFGVLTIYSMERTARDARHLLRSLEALKNCQYLLIDVATVRSASREYWIDNLFAYLTAKPLTHVIYHAVPQTELAERFYTQPRVDFAYAEKLPALTANVTRQTHTLIADTITVIPKGELGFKGKIWLRVGDVNFGGAEEMIQFAQATGLATVGGIRTGGGISLAPIPVVLPNSNLIVMCPVSCALNADGQSNRMAGTTPDVAWDVFGPYEDVCAWVAQIEPSLSVPRPAGPYVVGVEPFKNGARDVDPNIREITVRFNEPVGNHSSTTLNYRGRVGLWGRAEEHTMQTDHRIISVELKPDTEYFLQIMGSSGRFFGMPSLAEPSLNVPDYFIRFRTRSN